MAIEEILGSTKLSIGRKIAIALVRDALISLPPLLWMLFSLKTPLHAKTGSKAPALPAKMTFEAGMGLMTAIIYTATLTNHFVRYGLQAISHCRSGGLRAVAQSIGTNVDLMAWAFLSLVSFFHPIFSWFALRDSEQKIIPVARFCFLLFLPYIALWGILIFGFAAFWILVLVSNGYRTPPKNGSVPSLRNSSRSRRSTRTTSTTSLNNIQSEDQETASLASTA